MNKKTTKTTAQLSSALNLNSDMTIADLRATYDNMPVRQYGYANLVIKECGIHQSIKLWKSKDLAQAWHMDLLAAAEHQYLKNGEYMVLDTIITKEKLKKSKKYSHKVVINMMGGDGELVQGSNGLPLALEWYIPAKEVSRSFDEDTVLENPIEECDSYIYIIPLRVKKEKEAVTASFA